MATSFFGGSFFGGEFFNTPAPPPTPATGGAGGLITFLAHKPVDWVEVEKKKLEIQLAKKRAELKKVEKKIQVAEKKAAKRPDGILANLHLLEARANTLISDIETIQINLDAVLEFLGSLEFDDDDDDVLLLL